MTEEQERVARAMFELLIAGVKKSGDPELAAMLTAGLRTIAVELRARTRQIIASERTRQN